MLGSFRAAHSLIRIDPANQIRAEPDLFHMEIVLQGIQFFSQRRVVFIALAQREAQIISQ